MPNGMGAQIADVENFSYATFSDALVCCISGVLRHLWYSGCYATVEARPYPAVLHYIRGRHDAGLV